MMENSDKILEQFFAEHRQNIVDGGFTHRVMKNLPDRQRRTDRLFQILTGVIYALAGLLFILLGGMQLLWNAWLNTIDQLFQDIIPGLDVYSSIAVGVVLFCLVVCKVYSIS